MEFGVFLSHSEEDHGLAWHVKDVLDRTNIKTYIFEEYQKPGEPLADMVTNAMKKSSFFAVLLTKSSLNSQWVNQEIGIAHALEIDIIPIVEENLLCKGLIEFRTRLPFCSNDPETMIYRLLRRLRELLNRCEQEINGLLIKCPYCNKEFSTLLPSCKDIDNNIEKFNYLQCSCDHCGHDDVYVNPFTFDQTGVNFG